MPSSAAPTLWEGDGAERERDRQTDRQTDRDRERHRQTDRLTDRDRETGGGGELENVNTDSARYSKKKR